MARRGKVDNTKIKCKHDVLIYIVKCLECEKRKEEIKSDYDPRYDFSIPGNRG